MDVPSLPPAWKWNEDVVRDYKQWVERTRASGKSDAVIRDEWKNVVRPHLSALVRFARAFPADEEGNPLMGIGDVFGAREPVPEGRKRFLTLEMTPFGGDPPSFVKPLRDPMRFTMEHARLPRELLVAGAGQDFLVSDPLYDVFLRVLYVESGTNVGASRVLAVLGNTSDFGASGVHRITLRVKGSSPDDIGNAPIPMDKRRMGLSTAEMLLSSHWLNADVGVEDGKVVFAPSRGLDDAVKDYFAKLPPSVKDACAYDAIVETFKASWDKHYTKLKNKLTHDKLRDDLGKTGKDGWKVAVSELQPFFEEHSLSCVVMDVWDNVVWKYVSPVRNGHISPDTLYLIVHNEHVWRITTEAMSLSHTGVKDKPVATGTPKLDPPSPFYRVLPDLEGWKTWVLCDTEDDVLAVFASLPERYETWLAKQDESDDASDDAEETERSHHKRRPPRVNVHYSGNMELLFARFRTEFNYEPEIAVRDASISELRFHLTQAFLRIVYFNVEGEPSFVRKSAEVAGSNAGAGAGAVSQDDYGKYLPLFASVKTSFLHRDFVSYYSHGVKHAFQTYPRTALYKNFVSKDEVRDGVGVDIVLAYTSVLRDVARVPVFSAMDEFRAWTDADGLDDDAFYLVENLMCDGDVATWLVLDRRYTLVSGWTLREAGFAEGTWRILGWVRPSHLANNPFPDVLDRVVETFGDPIPDIGKSIFNSLIGLTGKRKAQTTRGRFTTDYNEAWLVAGDPTDIYAFADGYIGIARSEEVMLENGFFPIQFVVYDRMRVALLRLYRALVNAGADVYGVNADCFVVSHVPDGFPIVSSERRAETIGKWRREKKVVRTSKWVFHPTQNDPPTRVNVSPLSDPRDMEVFLTEKTPDVPVYEPYVPPADNPSRTIDVKGNAVRIVDDGTLVLGACAGSGKTTACVANCVGRTLIVVPTNKRVDEFETMWGKKAFPASVSDVVVMTSAEFLGYVFSDSADGEQTAQTNKKGPPSLDGYDTLFFDELFQGSAHDIIAIVQRVEALRKTEMERDRLARGFDPEVANHHAFAVEALALCGRVPKTATGWAEAGRTALGRRTKVFANGDTFQLTNHESWNNVGDKQAYLDGFVWRVFPRRVELAQNWRLTDADERKTLVAMLADLKAGVRPLDVMRAHGLASQLVADPDFVVKDGAPMPCLAWTNPYGNAVNARFGGDDRVGMEVVVKSYMMRRVKNKETGKEEKVGLRMNTTHVVKGINGAQFLVEEDGEDKWFPRNKFRRNIAWTTHAVQGETISRDFMVFQAQDNHDWRWFYTAVSRASSLRQAWVYIGTPLFVGKDFNVVVAEKIASYKEQDKKAGRDFDEKDYITSAWVKDTLWGRGGQNFCCAVRECMRTLLTEWDEDNKGEQFIVDRRNNDLPHTRKNCRLTCLSCNHKLASEAKK
jgi:hypothetical protein